MEGENNTRKDIGRSPMRPSSTQNYRVKQNNNNGETPNKTQKPRATPKKSDAPNLDAPIDFNSLQFDEDRPAPSRGIFDHIVTPHRRPPRVQKTPNHNNNNNNNNVANTPDPESAKKKRYRPRKKKSTTEGEPSDEILTEEVSTIIMKAQVDTFLGTTPRRNSAGRESYNRMPPPTSYGEASSYPPARTFDKPHTPRKTPAKSQTPVKTPGKTIGEKTPRQNTPKAPKTPNTEGQQSQSAKKRRPRKKGPKKEGTSQKAPTTPGKPTPGRTPQKTPGKAPRDRYEAYFNNIQVEDGLKNKTLYKGVIRINSHNPREAYVTVEGLDKDVYIDGQVARNRAFEGDIVIVMLNDKSKWKPIKKEDEEEVVPDKIAEQVVEELFDEEEEEEKEEDEKINKVLFSVENVKGIEDDSEEEEDSEEENSDEDSEEDSEEEEAHVVKEQIREVVHPKEEAYREQQSEETVPDTLTSKLSNMSISDTKPTPSKTHNPDDDLQPSGRIVCILESKQSKETVGYVKPINESGVKPDDRFASFVPMDIKMPRMIIPIAQIPDFYKDPESYNSKLVIAELVGWKSSSYLPLARFKSVLGESGDIVPETEAIMVQYRIDGNDFPAEVLDAIPKESYQISEEEIKNRRDLRNYRIFTVDPATAKDLDDALHITPLADGNFEVGVHIADVSYFVRPGTQLDEIARERSTTVYFVQKAIPMLPHVLCENLCSLNPGVDRLAFSVIWKLTPEGDILSEWFGRTVIRSCSKMTYDVAQYMIEGKIKSSFKEMNVDQLFKNLGPMGPHSVTQIVNDVLNMHKIAANMRKRRYKNGALSMNNVKLSFKLNEFGNPVTYAPYITREANHMIEEYMLLANQQVAARIVKTFPENSLLRNHTNPLLRKLDTFVKFCAKNLNIAIDPSSAKSLGTSLEALGKSQSPQVFSALRILATRSMQLAKYFCTGMLESEEWKHYALNVQTYTHFTSPIRRYPDIIVHRQLQAALDTENNVRGGNIIYEHEKIPTKEDLTKIATHSNDKKLLSRKAQEDSMKLYLCVYLKENPIIEDAVVLSTGEKYLTVILTSFGFEKRVFIEDLKINTFKVGDGQIILLWPAVPEELSNENIEQVIKVLSLIQVRVTTKLVRGRPELHLVLLHPLEAKSILGHSGVEHPPKVGEIPTAEYFAEESLD